MCLHFPINPRFTERFWHPSKYFFALADRQNNHLDAFFTRDVTPYHIYQKYDPFYLQFGFLHPTQMDVNNQKHKVNRVKMLHTIHNYLFVQHLFHMTNAIIHMNSRLQYANTKLTSPDYMNYRLQRHFEISTQSKILSCSRRSIRIPTDQYLF